MDKNNAKDFLPFVQALAEGKTIQCKGRDGNWNDIKYNINFDSDPECYRIKPKITKWWVIPENTPLYNTGDYYVSGPCYHVAEQEDYYSKSCPPLKSDFNSKEEAEKWLDNYLLEESAFQSAAKRFEIFSAIMSDYADRFKNHKQLEKHYLEFKVHEFLEDVNKMNDVIWNPDEDKGGTE